MTSVLHVITGLGAGGAEGMLYRLTRELVLRGWPQHVVSLKGRGVYAEQLEAAGVNVTALDIRSLISVPGALVQLAGLVRRLRPAALQGWMYHGNLAAALAHKLSPGAVERKLYWGLRASNMDQQRYGRIIGWNARLSTLPDAIIANSEAGRLFHLDQGFQPRRIEVIPNGIDTQMFCPDPADRKAVRKEWGIDADTPVALHVARVDPMKDQPCFLEAMAACPGVTAVMVGKDTEKLSLPGNVMALGLRRDVARLYRAADLIVSSSAFGEGFSNTTAEGMASGLVPVVTNVGDAKIIVGDTGPVVPPRDPRALARAIEGEAGAGRARLKSKGARARKRILEKFALKISVAAFSKLYGCAHDA